MPPSRSPVCRFSAPQGRRNDTPDAAAARWAAADHGVLHLDELRACGLTDKAIRVRVAAGRLHRIHPRVYAVGHPGLTREGRFLAAVKACGRGAVLSDVAAGVHWGMLE